MIVQRQDFQSYVIIDNPGSGKTIMRNEWVQGEFYFDRQFVQLKCVCGSKNPKALSVLPVLINPWLDPVARKIAVFLFSNGLSAQFCGHQSATSRIMGVLSR